MRGVILAKALAPTAPRPQTDEHGALPHDQPLDPDQELHLWPPQGVGHRRAPDLRFGAQQPAMVTCLWGQGSWMSCIAT
jgi:hypothetical protein